MTWVKLPKTKKSYHSNAVPAEEAATTVRKDAGCLPAGVSTATSAILVSPQVGRRSNAANGVVGRGGLIPPPRGGANRNPAYATAVCAAASSSSGWAASRAISVSRAAGEIGLPTTPSMPASRYERRW